jgi:hypothetical protein
MRKKLSILILFVILSGGTTFGQSFDWNVRGGLNLMKARTDGKDLAVLYHVGLQAGVRIASFGFYGEALYSVHENQNGGDPVSYIIPSLIIKGYWKNHIFAEFGGSYLTRGKNYVAQTWDLNPDRTLCPLVGLGAKISKLELSLRTILKQSASYGIIQITAAVRF